MRFMDIKIIKSSFMVFLFTFFMCLSFLIASFHMALAAQSEKEITAKLVEGAKKEGAMLFYFSMTVPEGDGLLKKFQEKYPFIKVGMYRSGSESMLPRIVAEDKAKKYLFDVVALPTLTTEVLKRKNLLAKYISPQGKFFQETFKDPDGYWVAAYYQLSLMAYNTKLVSPREAPKTYEDLLARQWKGKIGMDTGAFDWFSSILKIMGEEKGLQYMKRLSDQNIKFRSGRTLNCQMVAAGETSLAVPVHNNRVDMMKAQGAPIEYVFFEPLISDFITPSISAHAPHPNAAKLFVDFLLSVEGQEIIASYYRLPARDDVDSRVPRAKAKGLKLLPFDPGIIDHFDRYVKLYREVLMKK